MTDREKLIELIQYEVVPYFADRIADHLFSNGVTFQQWIPVTERLPKAGEKVLALIRGHCNDVDYHEAYMLAIFDPGRGWEIDGRPEMWDFCVTYWMPLPEPPKEV